MRYFYFTSKLIGATRQRIKNKIREHQLKKDHQKLVAQIGVHKLKDKNTC
jgi:hypothetical protein